MNKNEYRQKRIELAKLNRNYQMKKDHMISMMIRKMDASATAIKDYNQKHPNDKQLVPNAKLHKLTV